MTTWMAGLFYLPRLFVYHSKAGSNTKEYNTFLIMEKKLLKFIMNPSMILTWVFGILLVLYQQSYEETWLKIKFILVVLISIFHMYCARIRKIFEQRTNKNSEKFYRWINEVPTIIFLSIIYLVVFKPF
tara:strand:- start:70 stop:456 length:387 start_codon:yes stop_codon:yes gene_type:complete